jgi:ABC-type phosphate transport system auxiliary subunit
MSEPTTNLNDISTEKLEELKKKQMAIMSNQLPYLRVEEEYMKLQANIEKHRFEQLFYKLKWAEAKVSQNQKPTSNDDESTSTGEKD